MMQCPGYNNSQRCPAFVEYETIFLLLGQTPPPNLPKRAPAAAKPARQQAAVIEVDPETRALWKVIDEKHKLVLRLVRQNQGPQATFNELQYKDENGGDILQWAATYNNLRVVDFLIDHFPTEINVHHTDQHGRTPLIYASRAGNARIVERLLAVGAKPDVVDNDGMTPLAYAVLLPASDITDLLVRQLISALQAGGVRPPTSVLFESAHRCRSRVITHLISAFPDLDINATDPRGRTPLHVAANAGANDAVRVLLNSHALSDTQDNDGLTPLSFACRQSTGIIISLLTGAGANPSRFDRFSFTPLIWAAQSGSAQALPTLLDSRGFDGADEIFRAMNKARGQGYTEAASFLHDALSATIVGAPSLKTLVAELLLKTRICVDEQGLLPFPSLVKAGPSHANAQRTKE